MRFLLRTDVPILLAFEPTAAEYELRRGEEIRVEWFGKYDDGTVGFEAGQLVVHAPAGGYTRAWRSSGEEIYIGPESGPEAS